MSTVDCAPVRPRRRSAAQVASWYCLRYADSPLPQAQPETVRAFADGRDKPRWVGQRKRADGEAACESPDPPPLTGSQQNAA